MAPPEGCEPLPDLDTMGESSLLDRYRRTRARTLSLAAPLSAEDQVVQSMPDASPVKWHLAHTAWFFETFLLLPLDGAYEPFDPLFGYLFNSYYEAVGPRRPRPTRGLVTRPTLAEVHAYRRYVDEAMERLLHDSHVRRSASAPLIELGLAHEEQHQELILMDVLHLFSQMPQRPAYAPGSAAPCADPGPMGFIDFDGGVVPIGRGDRTFGFDNEAPRHEVLLHPYGLADRLVSNGEWLAFIADGGYARPELWLSDGWAAAQAEGWTAPGYWEETPEGWFSHTLRGYGLIDPHAPVDHVSYYEADAYARWAGARLPSEAEWEHAAGRSDLDGNFMGKGALRPLAADPAARGLRQLFGDVWEWTRSPYAPYPGFEAGEGAVGEYNGKFMVNQMVLRGGCCATPDGHVRATYRNFFYPHQRWQFAGVRLAKDADPKRASSPSSSFLEDVLDGLSKPQKTLSSKYLYDDEGSRLFEAITDLPEYYPTRTETALLASAAPEIAAYISDGAALVEFGSGASVKTRLVLDAAPQVAVYIPVDISEDALAQAAAAISAAYPDLLVAPLAGDFTQPLRLPRAAAGRPRTGFFPGSTIGNFGPAEAEGFLRSAHALLGEGAQFVVGADIVKDEAVLLAAYDDAQKVTAAFDLNLLVRINRELGGDIDVSGFEHRAVWNAAESRMEMHLVSLRDQDFHVGGRVFSMRAGETIHTENSYKFTETGFAEMAARAGWTLARTWISPDPAFGVFLLQG